MKTQELLNDKINNFELPRYEDINIETQRLIAIQCYFETFLNHHELYTFLLDNFSKDFLSANVDWDKINVGNVILVKNDRMTYSYCVTKKDDDKELELGVFHKDYLYKINVQVKNKRKNQCKCIYTESFRYSKALSKSTYKQEFKMLKGETIKRALDLKRTILQHTQQMGKRHG